MMSQESASTIDGLQRLARPLRYLYYRIYSWNLSKHGEGDFPQHNALLGTSFLMLLNVLSIPITLDYLEIATIAAATFRNLVIALMPTVLGIHYLLLFRRQRYLSICTEFAGESEESRRRGTVAVWFYVVASFTIFFGLAMIGALARS